MPKLGTDVAKATAGATTSFVPLEAGPYVCRLVDVEAKTASTGNPMWVWSFEVSRGEKTGKKLWVNTVLVEAALWKLGQVFDAFGVPTDTDTDELIGREIVCEVIQRKIGAGAREGQIGNDVNNMFPLSAYADLAGGGSSSPGAAAGAKAGGGAAVPVGASTTTDPGF